MQAPRHVLLRHAIMPAQAAVEALHDRVDEITLNRRIKATSMPFSQRVGMRTNDTDSDKQMLQGRWRARGLFLVACQILLRYGQREQARVIEVSSYGPSLAKRCRLRSAKAAMA